MCIYLCIYTFTSFLFRPLFLLLWSSYWPFLLPLIIWTLAAFVFHCWSPSVPGILRSPPTCLHPCAVCPGAERAGPQHQASLLQGLWLALGNGGSGRKLEIGGEGAGARRLDPARSPAAAQRQFESFEERPQLLPGSTLYTLETLFSQLCVWLCVLLTLSPCPARLDWGVAREFPLPGALQYPCLSRIRHFSKFPF